MWDLVGNPEYRFSHNEAQFYLMSILVPVRSTLLPANNIFHAGHSPDHSHNCRVLQSPLLDPRSGLQYPHMDLRDLGIPL